MGRPLLPAAQVLQHHLLCFLLPPFPPPYGIFNTPPTACPIPALSYDPEVFFCFSRRAPTVSQHELATNEHVFSFWGQCNSLAWCAVTDKVFCACDDKLLVFGQYKKRQSVLRLDPSPCFSAPSAAPPLPLLLPGHSCQHAILPSPYHSTGWALSIMAYL
jgi:hypothetical protein